MIGSRTWIACSIQASLNLWLSMDGAELERHTLYGRCWVTSSGLVHNAYWNGIQAEVKLDDLFEFTVFTRETTQSTIITLNPSALFFTIPATRSGLTYILCEGTSLGTMANGASKATDNPGHRPSRSRAAHPASIRSRWRSDCNPSRFPYGEPPSWRLTGTTGVSPVALMPNWESRHLGGHCRNVNSRQYRPWSRASANGGWRECESRHPLVRTRCGRACR